MTERRVSARSSTARRVIRSIIPRGTAHKTQYAVSTMCRLLEISRGWFYGFFNSQPAKGRLRADRHSRDQALFLQIIRSFKASKKRYGSKRVHWDIIASGEIVSERRVARIMRENKNSPRLIKRRKPITTDSNHKMAPSPNLLDQEFNCQMPNTIWLADITYVGTDQGWLYVAAIKDMATREIVGSLSGSCKHDPAGSGAMEDHMRAELCCEALKMALGRRDPVTGLVHHSPSRDHGRAMTLRAVDRGSQYAGDTYRKALKSAASPNPPLGSILRMRLPGSDEPKRSMSRQRANGELLCISEKRAGSSSALQNAGSGKSSNLPLSWFARKPLPGSGIHRDLLHSSAAAFCNRIQDATTSFRRHDLENGRIGSIVKLSGFRDEVHIKLLGRPPLPAGSLLVLIEKRLKPKVKPVAQLVPYRSSLPLVARRVLIFQILLDRIPRQTRRPRNGPDATPFHQHP